MVGRARESLKKERERERARKKKIEKERERKIEKQRENDWLKENKKINFPPIAFLKIMYLSYFKKS